MFDDYCVAILRGEPDLLDAERLEGIKVPITDLLSSDHEKPVRVYLALKQKLERSSGVTKYEEILKCVGLSAQVPDDISNAVHESQQIRHIWAHRAGRADARFVRAVPHLGFSTGDVVAISNQQARDYVQAVYVYGAVVLNRYRMRQGLLPLNAGEDNEHPFKASYTSLYPTNERANLDITGSPIPSVETPPDGGHLL